MTSLHSYVHDFRGSTCTEISIGTVISNGTTRNCARCESLLCRKEELNITQLYALMLIMQKNNSVNICNACTVDKCNVKAEIVAEEEIVIPEEDSRPPPLLSEIAEKSVVIKRIPGSANLQSISNRLRELWYSVEYCDRLVSQSSGKLLKHLHVILDNPSQDILKIKSL